MSMGEILKTSFVSSIILLVTVVISLFAFFDNAVKELFMMHPWSFIRNKRWYTLVTSGLIHADVTHLLFNMLTFCFFGFYLEIILGHVKFAILYVAALMLSDVSTIIRNRNNPDYRCLGASGAVTAVLFSYILYNPLSSIYIMFIPFGIPAFIFALIYIGYSIYMARKQYDNINHEAHLLGALTGLVLTVIFDPGVILRLPHIFAR